MTQHYYTLLETKDTGALVLFCPTCGRRIRIHSNPYCKTIEVEGDRWEMHRFGADKLLKMGETNVEER